MRRSLRRAARLLLAAGAVGLAQPAQAQSTPEIAPAARPKLSSGQAHLERMKVELAWLADSTCFAHCLEAHVADSSLEIRGTVPDEHVREHALRVARQNCFLPVVDALSVANQSGRKASSNEELRRAAVAHLVRAFGQRAAGFDVQIQDNGQLVLGGSVPSVEDKVAISRCLRELPGCHGVLNRLNVPPVTHAGQTVTLVSQDGHHMVAGALPAPALAPHAVQPVSAPPVQEPEPPLPRVAPSAPTYVLPSGLPPAQPARSLPAASPSWYSRPVGYAAPAPTATSTPVLPAQERSPLFPYLARLTGRQAAPAAATPAPTPPAQPVAPVPAAVSWPPAHAGSPRPTPVTQVSVTMQAPTAGGPVSAIRLQQVVTSACGPLARNVEVALQSDRTLVVKVLATSPAAEKQLLDRLMQVPEVTSPGVRLEVDVLP